MSALISVLSNTRNLAKELQRVLPHLTFQDIKNTPSDASKLKQSEYIVADYDLLGPFIYQLPNVKWVQGTWAGVDSLLPFVTNGEPHFPISRFSGDAFGFLMGEYVLGSIVNYERNFFQMRLNQAERAWQTEGRISEYRAIKDMQFGVMGLGSIGTRIGQLLGNLGGRVFGYGRRDSIDHEKFPFVEKYYTKGLLNEFLQQCDYLINVMPSTQETKGLLNDGILENCRARQAIFINIGRGTIISQEEILSALDRKWLRACVLDVFDGEPLSPISPLWTHENVYVTPHVSGLSRPSDIAEQFKRNWLQFTQNGCVANRIDFTKGY